MNAATPQLVEAGAPERTHAEVEITVTRSTDTSKEDVLAPAEVFAALLEPGEQSAVAWQGSGKLAAKVGPADKLHLAVRDDLDMWWTPNPTVLPVDERRKGTAEEISRLSVLPSDIDHRTERKASAIPDLPACYRIAEEFERRTGLYAPIAVETGGGLQYMVQIDPEDVEATLDAPGKRERAQRLARRHLEVFRAIAAELYPGAELDSVANLDRLHRMPGTRNHKYAHRPLVVARRHTGRPYTMEEAEEGLARVPVAERPVAPTPATVPSSTVTETDLDAGDRYVASVLDGVAARLRDMQARAKADPSDYDGPPWDATVFRECCTVLELTNSPWNRLDAETALSLILDNAPQDVGFGEQQITDKWRSAVAKVGTKGRPKPQFHDGFGIFDGVEPAAPSTTPQEAPVNATTTTADRPADQRRLAHELVTRPEYRDKLRHADGVGWLASDGKRFKAGAEKEAMATVDRLLADMWAEIRSTATNDEIRELRSLQRASAMKGALTIAASLAPYSVTVEDLDADPYLLNCSNGTLDMRTGELRPHSPADLITKVTRGAYHPGEAMPDEWAAFLARILPDEPVRSFLQRYVGSALIGRVREHVLAIWTGEGGNGKGTTDRALLFALGDYATVAQPRVLMREEGNEYDKVALRGARWVTMSETERDKKMAESTMKALTGGDVVQARIPYQLPMRFRPSHSLSLITNQLPTVSGDDPAVWRRIRVVPFDVTVPESEVIHDLDDRLELQADAVLAWAIQGYRDYASRGLDAPEQVMRATKEYREQSDDVANFIEECCEIGPHLSALATPLYQRYSSWATGQSLKPLSQTGFGKALTQKGYGSNKAGHVVRLGLALHNTGGWS